MIILWKIKDTARLKRRKVPYAARVRADAGSCKPASLVSCLTGSAMATRMSVAVFWMRLRLAIRRSASPS